MASSDLPDHRRIRRASPHRGAGLLVRMRHSDTAARLGLASFLLTFLLGPLLHTAGHREDHRHEADGGITWLTSSDHHSQPHPHAPSHPGPSRGDEAGPLDSSAVGPAAPEHGRGGAWHFRALLVATSCFVFHPAVGAGIDLQPSAPASDPLPALVAGLRQARAPPASRSC